MQFGTEFFVSFLFFVFLKNFKQIFPSSSASCLLCVFKILELDGQRQRITINRLVYGTLDKDDLDTQ